MIEPIATTSLTAGRLTARSVIILSKHVSLPRGFSPKTCFARSHKGFSPLFSILLSSMRVAVTPLLNCGLCRDRGTVLTSTTRVVSWA